MHFTNSLVFVFILLFTNYSDANDVIGCGGFVISSVSINYQPIQIKLYTGRGILKYTSDCAPNNGYYFIPLYDFGDYVLRIEAPDGWLFDPMEISFNFDGENDICSTQVDINFVFKGFSIFGKVTSLNSSKGPKGVKATLLSKANNNIIKNNVTDEEGSYLFQEILPGQYIVKASHESWKFVNNELLVDITNDNYAETNSNDPKKRITVLGYSVSGSVVSDNQPVNGVQFALFGKNVLFSKDFDCSENVPAIVSKVSPKPGYKYLCNVLSDKQGVFNFKTLPHGSYVLHVYYQVDNIHFEVVPSQYEFEVAHDDLVIEKRFEIGGFSVSGSVSNRFNLNDKIKNIQLSLVDLNGKNDPIEINVDSSNGKFTIEKVKTSKYIVKVKADNYQFEDVVVNISPNSPNIPPIIPSKFQVCGKLIFKNYDINYENNIELLITEKETKTVVDNLPIVNKDFCVYLPSGNYVLQLFTKFLDLKFIPYLLELKVDKPKLDISFEQLTMSISGKIILKSELSNDDVEFLTVTLANNKNILETFFLNQLKAISKTEYQFKFNNVLPGEHLISLGGKQSNHFCWENDVIKVNSNDGDITNIVFKQNGFIMKISLSHLADLTITSPSGKSEKINQNSIGEERLIKHCVQESGIFKIAPHGCHKFSTNGDFSFDTRTMTGHVVSLTATEHKVTFFIRASLNISDLVVNVHVNTHEGQFSKKITSHDYNIIKSDNSSVYEYKLSFYEKSMANIVLEPVSSQLLFKPASHSFKLEDQCYDNAVTFQGKYGVIINGQINEKLENVIVNIYDTDKDDVLFQANTDANGKFISGPFDDDLKLRIEPIKEGYIFKEIPGKLGHFEVNKLSSINVHIVDENGGALDEVLLSLSGGENNFRKNSFADSQGTFHFGNLYPGEYFIRFLRKEYEFEPSSKMVTIRNGDNVNIEVKGKKVAFSCLGTVDSLNGDPESGILVEAIGLRNVIENTSISCSKLQEEAVTESDGSFRILGLLPQCQYAIRLKTEESSKNSKLKIKQSIPRLFSVRVENSDLTGMRFIIFFENFEMDISVAVQTEQEYLSSLQLLLIHESKGVLYKESLSSSPFIFLPSVVRDNSSYKIQIESNLHTSMYDYTNIIHSFNANQSFLHLNFEFKPTLRSHHTVSNVNDQDITISSSIFMILIVLSFVYNKQLMDLIQNLSCKDCVATFLERFKKTSNNSEPSHSKKKTKSKKAQ